MATTLKDNKKCFYKNRNKKKGGGVKENLHPLFSVGENIVTKAEERDEVLNAFFASVFLRKSTSSQGTQLTVLKVRDREHN